MDPLRTHAPTTSKWPDPPILARIPRGSPADPLRLPSRSPGVPHATRRRRVVVPTCRRVDGLVRTCRRRVDMSECRRLGLNVVDVSTCRRPGLNVSTTCPRGGGPPCAPSPPPIQIESRNPPSSDSDDGESGFRFDPPVKNTPLTTLSPMAHPQ